LALLAACWGIRDARRHARQPVRSLVILPGQSAATCDGERMEALEVAWRGPLAFLSWRGEAGVMHRLSFWPDTLDPGLRRELRLAMMRREAATPARSVAG
jgi:toxin CptA